jgi:predicted dehydrogenase
MSGVRIGLVGAGFAADFHAAAYGQIGKSEVRVVAVASAHAERAASLASKHGIPRSTDDYRELLADPEVDAVDVCVPNRLHEEVVVQAARAGKHVFCEKPLTGYYGPGSTPKREMLARALESADAMLAAAESAGVILAYGENWLHAPPYQKALSLALASNGRILEVRGEEAHSGSHASYAKTWRLAGGGSLVRLGSHPLGGALHLKAREGIARSGKPIRVRSVTAEVGDLSSAVRRGNERSWLVTGWEDVESWATVLLTFEDGTRATIAASDVVLGGMEDRLEILLSNSRIRASFARSNLVEAYAPDPEIFAEEYIAEKLETKAGWSYPSVDEHWLLGYPQEMRDFVEAIADERPPRGDGRLGRDVVEVMYAAYVSAEEGRRVELPVVIGR